MHAKNKRFECLENEIYSRSFIPLKLLIVYIHNGFCISSAPDENSFDHNFSRLERLLRNHDEVEDIPKVCVLILQQVDACHVA